MIKETALILDKRISPTKIFARFTILSYKKLVVHYFVTNHHLIAPVFVKLITTVTLADLIT